MKRSAISTHLSCLIPQSIRHFAMLSLLGISINTLAVTPDKEHYFSGMYAQGIPFNLYYGCAEGNVSCDDMLLVAPDLERWALTHDKPDFQNKPPFTAQYYPAKTLHSTGVDGVPSMFHGYTFRDKNNTISSFIDPTSQTISISKVGSFDQTTYKYGYQEANEYLPLTGDAELVDFRYQQSDKSLNESYRNIKEELTKNSGQKSAQALKQDQIIWIQNRSRICGADKHHQPRSQIEKLCFMQLNKDRENRFSLWLE
ncbi:lysozyme inhibitor LprI family protein [Psychrobacter sp. I-STPA6b]|uniref:lysozyme inhibitor LprI family protein n=1 Tax=Psychrobacter sp. I-STPA6b TaxID=2585718 RepID=UPI001D0C44C8|nr:lysozyme inhibitor LprI family protein [Psychrobacter sp. I-STPA6b]